MHHNKDKRSKDGTSVLAAAALQQHLVKSLGLGDMIGPRHVGPGPATRAKQKKVVRPTIDTGRHRLSAPVKKEDKEREYVLDRKPPPLTLAQKMGLVEAPGQLLSETEWQQAKDRSNRRDDSKHPCVICKEDFGFQEQVLLSCTHVFHRSCLQAFERFTGRKTCPMCRKEQYQTRVIHEGSRQHRHKCATMIQAWWRGYVVRCWYMKLRETNPPKDPRLRKKFYEDKLHKITDRMVRSCDFNVNQFLRDIDAELEASRDVFRAFDARFQCISEEEWETIQLKAVERGNTDCPICLTDLVSKSYIEKPVQAAKRESAHHSEPPASNQTVSKTKTASKSGKQSNPKNQSVRNKQTPKECNPQKTTDCDTQIMPPPTEEQCEQSACRQTVLLSCSHVFHDTCLHMFEELSLESNNVCPVCRTQYQKKILAT